MLRSIWPTVAGEDGAKTAYALDAALQEAIFIGGPLLVAVLAVIDPVAAIVGAGLPVAVGTTVFTRIPPVRAAGPAEERHSARLGALSAVGVRTLALLSLWLGLAFGSAEIAVPAFAESAGNRALAGVALAGFWPAARRRPARGLRPSSDERRRLIFGTTVLAGLMALPLAAGSIGSLALLLFLAGLPIAPVVAAIYGQIGRVAAAGSVAEAFSWFGTSVSIGIAGGSVAGGWLIDSYSWRWRSCSRSSAWAWVRCRQRFGALTLDTAERPCRAARSRRTRTRSTTLLEPAADRGDALRVEAEPVHPADVARVLHLDAAIHDDGHAARFGDAGTLLVDHAELAPERAGADLDRVRGDGRAAHRAHGTRSRCRSARARRAGSRSSSRRGSPSRAGSPGMTR